MSNAHLLNAFHRTTYCARLADGAPIRIRIGAPTPELDAAGCWAYVTAHNPGAVPLDAAQNAARHEALLAHVRRLGHPCFEGLGVPDDPGWTPETSLLILGMSEGEAVALGRAFGQVAVVVGEAGQPARLRACDAA